MGKHCPVSFFAVLFFIFREITHAKVQVFLNQPWWQMCASLISLFLRTKSLFGKDAARKNSVFLHMSFVENKRETSELK